MKSLSRVWLFTTQWTAAHQAPPSMGFSRQECWNVVPSPSPPDHWTTREFPVLHSFFFLTEYYTILLYGYTTFILIYFVLDKAMPIVESLKFFTRRCENALSWCQKLKAERLQRFGSRLCLSFLIKGVALPMLNLAQEPEESWTPINISYKGQRVFRFFLNSKGFDTERIQASLIQQFPPCSQSP